MSMITRPGAHTGNGHLDHGTGKGPASGVTSGFGNSNNYATDGPGRRFQEARDLQGRDHQHLVPHGARAMRQDGAVHRL